VYARQHSDTTYNGSCLETGTRVTEARCCWYQMDLAHQGAARWCHATEDTLLSAKCTITLLPSWHLASETPS
jgi:hypothetical protein